MAIQFTTQQQTKQRAFSPLLGKLGRSMKRVTIALLLVAVVFAVLIYAAGYHGARSFSSRVDALPEVESVVAHAHSLSGAPYDPLMGTHGNIGASAGFIVCSDVPNLAYGLAGYSLQSMLEGDFKTHPLAYDTANGNEPGNPYFHRRARNLYACFKANGRAVPPSATPKVGDLAFYHHDLTGGISHVALVTAVEGGTYRVMESAPETFFAQELPGTSIINRGWLLIGFGRMYQDSQKQ